MRTLAINADGLAALRAEHRLELDKELAERIDMDRGTVSRVLQRRSAPGPTFISAVLSTFPVKFEDIFDVIDDGDAEQNTTPAIAGGAAA